MWPVPPRTSGSPPVEIRLVRTHDEFAACEAMSRDIWGAAERNVVPRELLLTMQHNGGLVHGHVETLAVENLEDGRDLSVTTDFRSVFSEVADRHLQLSNDRILFPDWNGNKIGVMNSLS